jgi:hypothetical protein
VDNDPAQNIYPGKKTLTISIMKKFKWVLIFVLALAVIAVFVIVRNSSESTLDKNTDFAVLDTGNLTKIFLADKNNNTVTLQRKEDGKWTVNEQYKAADFAIKIFMKTLMSLEVKCPIAKEAHDNIIKILATNSTKVEIYQTVYRIELFDKIKWFPHEKLTKTYYVGFATQDNLGTYMLMDGSEDPYIVCIPGFNGFLSTRYSTMLKDWRDHSVFNLRYKEIKSVTLKFPENPEQSFKAVKKGPQELELSSIGNSNNASGTAITVFDTLKLLDYFSSFENLRFESIVDDIDQPVIDSIKKSVPYHIITVEDEEGKLYSMTTFHMKGAPDMLDIDQKPVLWDRDRMYALVNDNKDFVLVQFFVFDPVLKPLQYFLRPTLGESKTDTP